MAQSAEKNYKATLNLPKTSFSMKADLTRREPQFLKKWDEMDLYAKVREARSGRPVFLLHDGPPYASGDLHIGTGLNKVLKDIIVRYKSMSGWDSPFRPGWDCHGLPIEHKVMTELGDAAHTMEVSEIRRRCRNYALKFVERQKKQFRRLGCLGDWGNPYLTLDPAYEAGVLDIFADLVGKGYVYRNLKPIHWCMQCATALAEAELEYADDESPSIFVKFNMADDVRDLYPAIGDEQVSILIWTTTPWTLPANLAVAVNPHFDYAAVRYSDPATAAEEVVILAEELVESVFGGVGIQSYETLGSVKGSCLEGRTYRHCLFDKTCPVVTAEYVAMSDTGCVHTAPGHGEEDYRTGLAYGLEVFSPVDAHGRYTEKAGKFAGLHVFEANTKVIDELRDAGLLLNSSTIRHSYPHCWRCKEPVIFRATEQWFVSMSHEDLRQDMLGQIAAVQWIPGWGQVRIRSMVEQRPDWCISRQRWWGIPIPAFYCEDCGEVALSRETVEAVRDHVAEHGSDSWFTDDAADLLPPGYACTKCGGTNFRKETDIFDVWFESGSSHRAAIKRSGWKWPVDLYLEGTDQHRGWFQLSLLTATGADGAAPFKTVLTHGFVVDERGEKMSKSLGNFISVEDMLERFGADIFRLWVSSVDYRQDISLSFDLVDHLSSGYRRIRNTIRYLLGNLNGFDPATDAVDPAEMVEIDRWALSRAQSILDQCIRAYEAYEFHRVFHLVHNFCAVDMSSFYLDILKDRLYASGRKSVLRRSAQTAMCTILDVLLKVLAPIMVYTVEDAWEESRRYIGGGESPHLELMPEVRRDLMDSRLEARWARLVAVRDEVARELEKLRNVGEVRSSMEAEVVLHTDDPNLRELLEQYESDLADIFIVAAVGLSDTPPDNAAAGVNLPKLNIAVGRSPHAKCNRCWNLRDSVGSDAAYPDLCSRCADLVKGLTT